MADSSVVVGRSGSGLLTTLDGLFICRNSGLTDIIWQLIGQCLQMGMVVLAKISSARLNERIKNQRA